MTVVFGRPRLRMLIASAIVVSATRRADAPGLTPAQMPGGSSQVTAGTAFNPAITVIPDGLYYYDNASGRASSSIVDRFRAPGARVDDTAFQQDGLYAPLVYGVGPRWTLAGRIDVAGLRNRIEALTTATDLDATSR